MNYSIRISQIITGNGNNEVELITVGIEGNITKEAALHQMSILAETIMDAGRAFFTVDEPEPLSVVINSDNGPLFFELIEREEN